LSRDREDLVELDELGRQRHPDLRQRRALMAYPVSEEAQAPDGAHRQRPAIAVERRAASVDFLKPGDPLRCPGAQVTLNCGEDGGGSFGLGDELHEMKKLLPIQIDSGIHGGGGIFAFHSECELNQEVRTRYAGKCGSAACGRASRTRLQRQPFDIMSARLR
jgi:hypothetical protein